MAKAAKKPLTKTEFINWLKSKGACSGAMAWARKQRRGRDIVEKCERVDWLEWLIGKIGGELNDDYWAKRKPLDDDYYAKVKPLYDDYEAKLKPLTDDYWAKRKSQYADYAAKRKPLAKSLLTWERVSKAVRS
jgi:hypothetical protein